MTWDSLRRQVAAESAAENARAARLLALDTALAAVYFEDRDALGAEDLLVIRQARDVVTDLRRTR